jgi:hypothetical protein
MNDDRVVVRAVRGRYPHRAGKVEGKHIEASVREQEGERVVIRLDDAEHPDFWLELVLEVQP